MPAYAADAGLAVHTDAVILQSLSGDAGGAPAEFDHAGSAGTTIQCVGSSSSASSITATRRTLAELVLAAIAQEALRIVGSQLPCRGGGLLNGAEASM
jgi:hypothetical protein